MNALGGIRSDWRAWGMVCFGLAALYIPTLWRFFHGTWLSDEQAHGPMILAISCWLIYRSWPELMSAGRLDSDGEGAVSTGADVLGWGALVFGLALYVVGRSQGIEYFELGSAVWVLLGLVLVLTGFPGFRVVWFPLFFLIFMVPLPGLIVAALTTPMKIAVSHLAESVLYGFGYPVARSGVILQIGQYQLLVADACAGLHTLFTLESMGLLYLNLVRHQSVARNVLLAILIAPISFLANVIRVISLTLVTYYFGDEVGQGFVHGFAGMVLFLSALVLVIGIDSLLHFVFRRRVAPVGV